MPILFLIDTGSVTSTCILDDGFTIQDGIVRAMCNMLESMKNTTSFMPIQILRLGGGKEIQRPTTDFDLAISALKSYQLDENSVSDPFIGLSEAIELNQFEYGSHTIFQLVIIGFLGNPISEALSAFTLPSNWSTHWILFHKLRLDRDIDRYQHLPCQTGSKIEFLNLENFELASGLQSFVDRATTPLHSHLCMGHIQMEVDIVPNPRSVPQIRKSSKPSFTPSFPSVLSIVGFLPDRIAFIPPSTQRYVILARDSSPQIQVSSTATEYPSRSGDSSVSSLLLLCHSLYESEKAAVVNLGHNWFGLLFSQTHLPFLPPSGTLPGQEKEFDPSSTSNNTSKGSKLHLFLIVLDHDSELPFVGPIQSMIIEANENYGKLTIRSEQKKESAMDLDSTIAVSPLPLMLSQAEDSPSYYLSEETTAESWPLLGDAASVAIEISRFHALLFELPAQRVPLFQQTERIRQLSSLFSLPHLMEQLLQLIQKEVPPSKTQSMKSTVIKHLVESITYEAFPIHWEDEWELDMNRTRSRKRRAR
jgi:hypothetical protein